jgi:hypothetical protein
MTEDAAMRGYSDKEKSEVLVQKPLPVLLDHQNTTGTGLPLNPGHRD